MRPLRLLVVLALALSLGACATCDPNRRMKTGAVAGLFAGAASGAIIGASVPGYALAEAAAGAYLGHLGDLSG